MSLSESPLSFELLKERQRNLRDSLPEFLDLRLHRALSWLQRAELCEDDDGAFIFLWIALNAAYANDTHSEPEPEENTFHFFIKRIVQLDRDRQISDLLWDTWQKAIKHLLDNQYVYQRYWDFQNQKAGIEEWQISFNRARDHSKSALANQQTDVVLNIVMDRLYTLRNQLVHGGATCGGSVNRSQVMDGRQILASLVPLVIAIMLDNADEHWGEPYYPVRKREASESHGS
ncbi:HEPN domain-containing protein [Oceanobacter mangrovi]|uniref:HEPN domain-containing protein n=1 Tax=Oceanobacter mangrovi TaxID=2862510 RepID=UPI001C8DF8B4|nr:HEPN domain-containing protein [Oceanobacter mangrovi]